MTGEQRGKPGFNIGLSLAGAVSGGSYSAGVFDFLMEALSEWQKAKDAGQVVPMHDVFISALSGTSAGGITAAMGLASLAGGIRPTEAPSVNPACSQRIRRVLPELYDIWVKKVRLFDITGETGKSVNPDSIPSLLDTSDIKTGCAPASLLNSDVLTRIARNALSSIQASGQKLPFFCDPTHLFLTHTNLDGVPYPIEFATGEAYTMMLHEGRSHFAVTGLGTHQFPAECDWLEKWKDHGVRINLAKLGSLEPSQANGVLKEPYESFAQAALTTSAFPFGFSARRVIADRTKLRSGAMPFDPGSFPTELNDKFSFIPLSEDERMAYFACIDGGAMNNEPFEIVRWAIRASATDRNARDPKKADRAVILIAPFPPHASLPDQTKNRDRAIGIDFIGKALIPALINQARFKASDLIAASDPTVYSRFLISPKPKLASEPLFAFGGFLDEQFREYDFQLGRRNCQRFLQEHFTLDRANPVFDPNAEAHYKAIEDPENPFGSEWPVIPLVGSAAQEVPLLEPWPLMPRHNLIALRNALQKRCDLLVAAYASQAFTNYPSLRFGARLSWWRHRRRVIDSLMRTIEADLKGHLEPPPQPTAFARLINLLRRGRWALWLLIAIAMLIVLYQVLLGDSF